MDLNTAVTVRRTGESCGHAETCFVGVVFIFTSARLNSQLSIRDRNIRADGVEILTRIE
jgi:hypothetical protein